MSEQLTWRYLPLGEGALLVDANPPLTLANSYVLSLANLFSDTPPVGVQAAVPAINSLLITFDPLQITLVDLCAQVRHMLEGVVPAPATPSRIVDVPVRYGGTDGPDLEEVAHVLALHPDEVVALHCAQVFRVMMIGFAPGFPYIGPLPAALNLPRRDTPRTVVPSGSVAIAAGLTGIYPTALPGGWHLIGRTDLSMFDPGADPPALLAPGDGVRFIPVTGGATL